MKILAVRLCNLNSLVGRWEIDFTTPEYGATGLFAITGPTGAGKSTLLDAICLALFGRTPRLGPITKGSNEILSRRTGECSAEVDFAISGGLYRCHWGQHRAHRKAQGELQPPKHELADARSGTILESRTREVVRLVEELTGMDFDRFTRSMLLAQGAFAAFLDADADQRAPILEQITGTGIYSRISMAVHERTSEERKKTESLQQQFSGIHLLLSEEEQTIQDRIEASRAKSATLSQSQQEIIRILHHRAASHELEQQVQATERQRQELQEKETAAQEDLTRFHQYIQAQPFENQHLQLAELEARLQELQHKEEDLRQAGELLRQVVEKQQQDYRLVVEQLSRQQKQGQEEEQIRKQVRELDLYLRTERKAHDLLRQQRTTTTSDHKRALREQEQLSKQLKNLAAQREQHQAYFTTHAQDGQLVEQLTGLRRQAGQLVTKEQRLAQIQAVKTKAEQHLSHLVTAEKKAHSASEKAQAEREQQQHKKQQLEKEQHRLLGQRSGQQWREQLSTYTEAAAKLQRLAELGQSRDELGQQRRKYQAQGARFQEQVHTLSQQYQQYQEQLDLQTKLVTQLERNQQLHQQIQSYQEARAKLVTGSPCPLCGALEHPWGEALPAQEDLQEPLTQARNACAALQTELTRQGQLRTALDKDIEYTTQNLQALEQQDKRLHQEEQPLQEVRHQLASEFGLTTTNALQAAIEGIRTRLAALATVEMDLNQYRISWEQANQEYTERQALASEQRHARIEAEHALDNINQEWQQLTEECRQERTELGQELAAFTATPWQQGQETVLLEQLTARVEEWKQQQTRYQECGEQQGHIRAEEQRVASTLKHLSHTLIEQEQEETRLQATIQQLQHQRYALYGDRDPEREEQQHKQRLLLVEQQEHRLREQLAQQEKELHGKREQFKAMVREKEQLAPRLQAVRTSLEQQIHEAGFADLAAFRQALLPAAERVRLARLQEQLEKERTTIQARHSQLLEALHKQRQEQTDPRPTEILQQEQRRLQEAHTALVEQLGADREQLATNERRKNQWQEQQQVLEAQRREQQRWELLHQLIGSADGKKFRVFAQGLTFEVMIGHANLQLQKMNDRYLLARDPGEPLALQVVDSYQAGEIRSTKNLSGGESFLVSLALALGLSGMASHQVRVDSLFLDEGFGSLDEEALDIALQTLAELQHDGKLIGVISHVPQLQERIDVRIRVCPEAGGRSVLKGPGCRRLS